MHNLPPLYTYLHAWHCFYLRYGKAFSILPHATNDLQPLPLAVSCLELNKVLSENLQIYQRLGVPLCNAHWLRFYPYYLNWIMPA